MTVLCLGFICTFKCRQYLVRILVEDLEVLLIHFKGFAKGKKPAMTEQELRAARYGFARTRPS